MRYQWPHVAAIAIGAQGQISGRNYRVTGHAKLTTTRGPSYSWIEYRVINDSGAERILVEEPVDDDLVWRFFDDLENDGSITPQSAGTLRAGDRLTYGGLDYTVTYTSTSQVCEIDGRVFDDYAIGVEERFFNAELGNKMLVGTWREGKPVSLFSGITLAPGIIPSGFDLREPEYNAASGAEWSLGEKAKAIFGFVAVSLFIVIRFLEQPRDAAYSPPPAAIKTADRPEQLGQFVSFEGQSWQVAGHALLLVRSPAGFRQAHLYSLQAGRQERWLLESVSADAKSWLWLTPNQSGPVIDTRTLPFLRRGFRPGWYSGTVASEFQLEVLKTSGSLGLPLLTGTVFSQGLLCQLNEERVLLVWNEREMRRFDGIEMDTATVNSSLPPVR